MHKVALHSAQDRLDAFLAAAPDGILLCDAAGRILLANERAGKMFGYRTEELLGQPVEMLIPSRLQQAHIRERSAYVAAPTLRPMGLGRDLVALCRDGAELPVEISLAPLQTESGLFIVNIVRDVTERRRLQGELTRRNDDLIAADRRKNEFLAVLSHELRNPLAPIRAAVDVLRSASSLDPDVKWATDVIARQSDQMSRLIDDLLDLSRITQGKIRLHRRRVLLSEIVASAVETSRPWVEGRNHVLDIRLPQDEVWLEVDPLRLSQVVANLINNAAKYSDESSTIWLKATAEAGALIIRVRDRGIGIAPDFLPRLFESFAQAERSLDRAHGGLGIGLTLVKSLVELHGGTVRAASEGIGQGSEFAIQLPLASTPVPATAPARPAATAARTFKILIADDNVDFAESVARLLKRRGHEVKIAHDGNAACELAESFRPEVALLDIGLPVMSGYDVARHLRQLPATEKALIVAISGYGRDEDRERSRASGFDEHLTKPIQIDTLAALLAIR